MICNFLAYASFASHYKALIIRLEIFQCITANNYLCSFASVRDLRSDRIRNRITHICISAGSQTSFTVRTMCSKIIMQKYRKLRSRTKKILVLITYTKKLSFILICNRLCPLFFRRFTVHRQGDRTHNAKRCQHT